MTTSLTALIAEDEPLLAAGLKAELQRLWPELGVAGIAGDGVSAVTQALALQPTVCFFDIRMPGQTGLEAAQALAEDWPEGDAPFPLLVFVTAYDQYALQAFDAQAVDYLVKPVEPARLAACVARLKKRLDDRAPVVARGNGNGLGQPGGNGSSPLDQTMEQLRALLCAHAAPAAPRLDVIQASVGNLVHMVPVDEVLYFEAADKYIRVITADREHLIRLSLRELLPQLDAQKFWQVHRSLVVRASAITTALRDESGKVFLTLRGRPEKLTASRLYAHLFKGM
ncbi:LytR/AlgR family response regulator transcription factor [Aquabacterium humicola]|uniref:LytR/AlgR family response regulator transcription factor n=1 Tax=Aquabacterium humicola TaxID=3237377 RepID=UPI0025436E70|nr:LytTR family DNA-binding domain-containing protein [Rubrivivax pictus]